MSIRSLVLLAVLLVAVVSYIRWVEIPADEASQSAGLIFNGWKREEVQKIAINGPKGNFTLANISSQDSALKKEKGKQPSETEIPNSLGTWELADVPGSELDSAALNSLLTSLLAFKVEKPIPAKEVDNDLTVYGLKTPEVTLGVSRSGDSKKILFGKLNEYVRQRYIKLDQSPEIYLVPDELFGMANKSKLEFRDKTPLDFIDSDLAAISIKSGSTLVKLEAIEASNWKIVEPSTYQASSESVASLTRELRNLTGIEFIDEAAAKLGEFKLDSPEAQIELTFRTDTKLPPLKISLSRGQKVVEGGKAGDAYYIYKAGSNSIVTLANDPFNKVVKSVNELRERKLFQFATDNVVQADFDIYESEPVRLIKTGADWQVNGKPADIVFIKQLLRNLSELSASGFPTDNRDYGFKNPRYKVVIRLTKAGTSNSDSTTSTTEERTLVVGDSADTSVKGGESGYYAAADDRKEPFIISTESYRRLVPQVEALLKSTDTSESAKTPIDSGSEVQ